MIISYIPPPRIWLESDEQQRRSTK